MPLSLIEELGITILTDRPVTVYEIMTRSLEGATGFMQWTGANGFGCSDLDETFVEGVQTFEFRIYPHRDTDPMQIKQAARKYGAFVDEVGLKLSPI